MRRSNDREHINMKDLPAEFFLPPPTNVGLWQETAKLVGGAFLFILILALLVAVTQGVVIKV